MSAHVPVMLAEVVAALVPEAGKRYLDATFGRGGYSRALLAQGADVIGLDRDPEAVAAGEELARDNPHFIMLRGAFSGLDQHLASAQVSFVDGIAFDLGVSSPQLDSAERGFSFRQDGPLDMRMDNSAGRSAADLVNTLEERALADLIWTYGEERYARRVAAAIVARRTTAPFTRTLDLAAVVRTVVRAGKDGIDPATRTFQALRLAVNNELGELEQGLAAAERVLAEGGRLAVVSFHSLEDRIVKHFLRVRSGRAGNPSRHLPTQSLPDASFRLVGAQPVAPGALECRNNPRARSARLRVAERTGFPVWQGVGS